MTVLFALSSLPGDKIPLPGFRFSDKLIHFLAYIVLGAALGARHTVRTSLSSGRGRSAISAGWDWTGAWVGILYGLSDEVHQVFVPLRTFSVWDWAADALGVVAGILIYDQVSTWAGSRKVPSKAR